MTKKLTLADIVTATRLRGLEQTLAQFKQEKKELDIAIPYIESQISELQLKQSATSQKFQHTKKGKK